MNFFPAFCALFLCTATVQAQDSLISRVQNMKTSLVEVRTSYVKILRNPGGGAKIVNFERSGAGIIIDQAGLIVTNTHTVINAPHVFVVLADGRKLPAQPAYVNVGDDFTFLKVSAPYPLKAIQWADSSQARLGEEVVAVGSSQIDDQSILAGEITNIIQNQTTGRVEFIGVNLELYRGDSGGPIWDHEGRLLGMVMAKSKTEDRAGLAIASDKIREQYLLYKRDHPS